MQFSRYLPTDINFNFQIAILKNYKLFNNGYTQYITLNQILNNKAVISTVNTQNNELKTFE